MMNDDILIKAEGVQRSYPGGEHRIEVLKGIDMTIRSGEFISIMGKSGSGKTTLLKLLGLLDRPTGGHVFFRSEPAERIRGDKLAAFRRHETGFVYQDYYLMNTLSVRENIMLPMILDHRDASECLKEAEQLAVKMDVYKLLDKSPQELSGGEKQRVSICRALINRPEMILADEPTGNLDQASSDAVMSYFVMANKEMGKTIVMVTHDPYIAGFSNRVIFIKDGRLGSELIKKESYEGFCNRIIDEQKKLNGGQFINQ